MKKLLTNPIQLEEIRDLLERGYHCADTRDDGDYFSIILTNDNGNMQDSEITDVYFDFDYINTETND